MIGDQIENDVKALSMGSIDEGFEVLLRAELRVHFIIVLHRIGAAQRSLAVFLPDGVDRHQPQNIDTHFL